MDLESLPIEIQFIYIAMTKSVIYFKELGQDKSFYLHFAEEIWNSMELVDLEYLKDTISKKMQKDLEPCIKAYMENKNK